MAKTKENDWSIFLADLGYDANNPGDKAVINALKGKKTTPGKLANLWTEKVPLKECEDWLKGEGINSGDARTNIISGIKDLAPKGSAIIRDETLVLPNQKKYHFVKLLHSSMDTFVTHALSPNNDSVVMKCKLNHFSSTQFVELDVLSKLGSFDGIPSVEWSGFANEGNTKYETVILRPYGVPLTKLFTKITTDRVAAALWVASQLMLILEYIHNMGFLHRDIKPANIIYAEKIVLIDFNLSSRFYKTRGNCTGTVPWMSLAEVSQQLLSPFSDLQSLAYVLLDLAGVSLPWQRENDWNVLENQMKYFTTQQPETLCESIQLPIVLEFVQYTHRPTKKRVDYTYWSKCFEDTAMAICSNLSLQNRSHMICHASGGSSSAQKSSPSNKRKILER